MSTPVDNQSWRPQAGFDVLRLRARVNQTIREFFKQRGVLEVDTPVLATAAATDPAIESFTTSFGADSGMQRELYLITSPEFQMKRLLAAGSGSIYQICHVFRQSELGSQHNPEFTLLEWYRVGMGYWDLMKEVAQLVRALVKHDLAQTQYLTYQEAFLRYADIDPLNVDMETLCQVAQQAGLSINTESHDDRDVFLDFLMSHKVQPKLGKDCLTFIYEYPASQCALARLSPNNGQVAERFELFIQGRELANGFQELTDAREQAERFEADLRKRALLGRKCIPQDRQLVNALASGLPECSGVALGIDRLIQFMLNKKNIEDVLAFPFNRV